MTHEDKETRGKGIKGVLPAKVTVGGFQKKRTEGGTTGASSKECPG